MPPRKKVNGATAGSPPEALRRSTRASKGRSRGSNNSSSDELSSASVALGGHDVRSIEAEASQNPRNEEVADEITVCTTRTTRSKSYTASRPSTANSDSASQSRVISAPVTKRDIQTLYDGDKEGQDELAAEGPTLKKPKPTIKLISNSARKGRSKFDNPDEMLTNPRAPLAIVNLRDLLCSSKAWDILSPDEKQQVLAKFPDETDILEAGTENARPNITALRNNNNFRNDVARYQENLRKGWHDPEWIRQAQAAHRKREIGVYDEYLSMRFEEDWGMPLPEQEDGRIDQEDEEARAAVDAPEQESDSPSDHEDQDLGAPSGLQKNVQNGVKEHQEMEAPKQGHVQKDEGIEGQSALSGQEKGAKENEGEHLETGQKGNALKDEEHRDPTAVQGLDPLAQENGEDRPDKKVPEQQDDLQGHKEVKGYDATQDLNGDAQEAGDGHP